MALLTSPLPLVISFLIKLMPPETVSLPRLHSTARFTSKHIHARRNSLKMIGVHAGAGATEVINLKTFWNSAVIEKLVGEPVSRTMPRPTRHRKLAVAISSECANPNPASAIDGLDSLKEPEYGASDGRATITTPSPSMSFTEAARGVRRIALNTLSAVGSVTLGIHGKLNPFRVIGAMLPASLLQFYHTGSGGGK